MAHAETDITALVRQRLRGLRQAQGLSLDELGQRANLSPSTISRIETGRRNLSLETLVALAGALSASLDELMSPAADDDVVIRPTAREGPGVVTWWLNRPTSQVVAVKQRIDVDRPVREPQVHPGRDWFFVLSGTVRLTLGERIILVGEGEAAEFDTMIPHLFEAEGGPTEIISIFDHDGQRAHVHTSVG